MGLVQRQQEYFLDEDAVKFEAVESARERLRVRIRWGLGGPEGLAGLMAAEAFFTLPPDGNHRLLFYLEDNVEVEADFARFLCGVYGVQGMVEVGAVRRADVQVVGEFKVR